MRVERFDTFLANYAKSMNPEQTLSFTKSERIAKENHRFLTLFSLSLLFDEKRANTLRSSSSRYPTIFSAYLDVSMKYPNLNLENVASLVKTLPPFDELKKAYQSYLRLVVEAKRRDNNSS